VDSTINLISLEYLKTKKVVLQINIGQQYNKCSLNIN